MKPTDMLRKEHDIITLVVNAAEKEAQSIATTGKVDVERMEKIVEFLKNFADRCHHRKEEDYLFPRLEKRGMARNEGPIAVMLYEHDEGRELIKEISNGVAGMKDGSTSDSTKVQNAILRYVDLLRAHIMKENNVLFPMSDGILSSEDQATLEKEFHEVNQELGEGFCEQYERLAREL